MTMADIIELSSGSDGEESSENYANRKQFKDIWKTAVKVIPMRVLSETEITFPYEQLKATLSNVMKKLSLVADQKFKDFVFTRLLQLFQTFKYAYDGIGDEEKINFLLIDFMAAYINFKCGEYYSSDELASVVNKVLMILHVIFNGKSHFIMMTLLRVKSNTVCARIVYQIFKKYIYNSKLHNPNDLVSYIRLILLSRKWKYIDNIATLDGDYDDEIDLTSAQTLTHEIETYLPNQVPPADDLNRPFTRISDLIWFAIRKGNSGTKILLENESMNLTETIERFFRQYEILINRDSPLTLNGSNLCLKTTKTVKKLTPPKQKKLCVEKQPPRTVTMVDDFERIPLRERISAIGKMDVTLSTGDYEESTKLAEITLSECGVGEPTEVSNIVLNECSLEDQTKESDLSMMNCNMYDDINESDLFLSSYDSDSPGLPEDDLLSQSDISMLVPDTVQDKQLCVKDQLTSISKCEYTIEHKIDIYESQMMCIDKNISLNDLVNLNPLESDVVDRLEVKRYSLEIADKISFYRYDKLEVGNLPPSDTCLANENTDIQNNNLKAISNETILPPEDKCNNMLDELNNVENATLRKLYDPYFPGSMNFSRFPKTKTTLCDFDPFKHTFKFQNLYLKKFSFMAMTSTPHFASNLLQRLANIRVPRNLSFKNSIVTVAKPNRSVKKKIKRVTFKIDDEPIIADKKSCKEILFSPDTAKAKTYVSILRRNFKKSTVNKTRIGDKVSLHTEKNETSTVLSTITDVKSSNMKIFFTDRNKEKRLLLSNIFRNKISKVSKRALSFEDECEKGRENEASITNSLKRKSESKNVGVEPNRKKKKKISSAVHTVQSIVTSEHNWIAEEKLLRESLSNLKLEKLHKEIDVLLKYLTSLSKAPSLEVYFVINKIIVTFMYECLLSLDLSRITLRKYLSICAKAKKLQAKNIDNSHLSEIENKYEELKGNIQNSSIIYNFDMVLNALKDVKKDLFSDEWLQKNKNKIQKYMYMEPIELTNSTVRGCADSSHEKQIETLSKESFSTKSPLKSEQKNQDSIVANNIQKVKTSPINSSRPSRKFEDGLHCVDVSFCDFVGEYGSSLGSSNLDFMPDEIKLDGPIIPFPQNSGNFNDILEHSLSEADISSLSDNDTTDNFFSSQTLESNMLGNSEIFCPDSPVTNKNSLAYNHDPIIQSFEISQSLHSEPTIKTSLSSYVTQNDRNLINNPFWKDVIGGPNASTCRTIARTKD